MNLPDRSVFGVDLVLLVGVVALLEAVLVVVAPWLVSPVVRYGVVPALETAVAVGGLALLAGLVALRSVYRGEPRGEDASVELPPPPAERERRRAGGARIAGQSLDELLDRIADPESETRGITRRVDKGQVRDQVRRTAVDVLVDTGVYTPRTAGEALDRGTWTDRPRAAAFLGDRSLPLEVRIVDWLSGEGFERQVRAAVEELADMAGVETGSGIAPEPVAVDEGVLAGTLGSAGGPAGRPTEDARSAAAGGTDGTTDRDTPIATGGADRGGAGAGADRGGAGAGADRGGADGVGGGIDVGDANASGTADGADAGTDPEAERTAAREGSR